MQFSFSSLTKWLKQLRTGQKVLLHSKEEPLVFRTKTDRRVPSVGQLRYVPHLLKGRERVLFIAALVLFFVSLPVALGRGYLVATERVPDYGGSYTEGLVGAPLYVNPLLSSLSDVDSDLARLLFSGLFTYNESQELVPDLVTNYELSEDELTYTFYLRHNIEWHDSTEDIPQTLDADDVLFTIAAIQDPQYQSPLQSSLRGVKASKIDDTTFTLTLPEPFAPFLSSLTFGILPEHLWFNVPAQNFRLTELNVTPVGSGPFQFSSLSKDKAGNVKSIDLVRNEQYYGQQPYLDELHFIFYADTVSAIEALQSKKVEGLGFIPKADKANIAKKNPGIAFSSLRVPQYTAVFFNQKKSEVLKNDTVRLALAMGVNRGEIVSAVLNGEGEPIFTPILPGYVGHNSEVDRHDYNLEEANRILEEDGWVFPTVTTEEDVEEQPAEAEADLSAEPEFVPREKDGVQLEFTVSTVNIPEYIDTLALLQQNWQAIGVQVNVDTYSAEDVQSQIIKSRNYEALLFGQIVGSDPDPYPFWHSSQQEHPGLGLAIFRDTEVDGLLDEARHTSDPEERRLRYLHFQNNIASEIPAVFLYNPLYTYGVHQKIHGINSQQYITVPSDRFVSLTNWYTETRRDWK